MCVCSRRVEAGLLKPDASRVRANAAGSNRMSAEQQARQERAQEKKEKVSCSVALCAKFQYVISISAVAFRLGLNAS